MDSVISKKKKKMTKEQVPLLVKIQTIEVENLDFRATISKNKHITYVEGTSRFLFVGCTSGSVYVFSRESLQFLLIIPFKGGKVCGISCAEDEMDVAVGSLRGKVAIYRLLNLESNGPFSTGISNPIPCTVKLLYTVSHHTNNEITEMLWSPNGRYLFIGDNQGLISQVDVGSLEEFPRPPPSRVILQVQSRILQLDCVFPYLAVNTLAGVFLCDLENEDFTRIKNPQTRTNLLSNGICLMIPQDNYPPNNNKTSASSTSNFQEPSSLGVGIYLYVAARNNSEILRYGMQGNPLDKQEIQQNNCVFQNEVHLFDPKKQVKENNNNNSLNSSESLLALQQQQQQQDFRISLGKLFTCDEGYIISASNDRIVIIDPITMKIILWNDDFRRISSLKVLSNYLFIWETGKFHVLALTSFLMYGQQLYRANLHSVLENWIQHALNSSGWKKELELISDKKQQDENDDDDEYPLEIENTDKEFDKEQEAYHNNEVEEKEQQQKLQLLKTMNIEKSCHLFHAMMHYQNTDGYDENLKTFILSHIPKTIAKVLEEQDNEEEEDNDDENNEININAEHVLGGQKQEKEQEKFPDTPAYIALKKLSKALSEITSPPHFTLSSEVVIKAEAIDTSTTTSTTTAYSAINQHDDKDNNKTDITLLPTLYKILVEFYTEIEAKLPHNIENSDEDSVIYKQSLLQNKMTFDSLIQSRIWFLNQETLKLFEIEFQSSNEFLILQKAIPKIIDSIKNIFTSITSNHNSGNNTSINIDSCEEIDQEFIHAFQKQLSDMDSPPPPPQPILNFINQNAVKRWLTDFNISTTNTHSDAYLAEIFLLLSPIIQWTKSYDLSKILYITRRRKFFTWLILLLASRENKTFPYEQRLSKIFTEKLQGSNINEIISHVYKTLILLDNDNIEADDYNECTQVKSRSNENEKQEDDRMEFKPNNYLATTSTNTVSAPVTTSTTFNSTNGTVNNEDCCEDTCIYAVQFLHHFATFLYFKSMTKNSRNKILSSLITNFPLKSRPENEIKWKLQRLCQGNPILIGMYQEACLTDGNSQQLCSCGMPCYFGFPSLFMIPKTQRLIEQFILEILIISDHYSSGQLQLSSINTSNANRTTIIIPKKKNKCKQAFNFAMQRLLFDNYFELLNSGREIKDKQLLEDKIQLEIIFRSGQCHLLQKYFPFNYSRLELVIKLYEKLIVNPNGRETCLQCDMALKTLPNYKIISWDCLGLWILGSSTLDETERLTKVLTMTKSLNTPGLFSLKFYQLLACGERDSKEEDEETFSFSYTSRILSENRSICAALH